MKTPQRELVTIEKQPNRYVARPANSNAVRKYLRRGKVVWAGGTKTGPWTQALMDKHNL